MAHIFKAFAGEAQWAEALARALSADIEAALDGRPDVLVAVAGGRTPPPVLERLCAEALPWARISFTVTDERVVPRDHPARNVERLRSWLAPAIEGGARIVELADVHRAPDVVLLGFGADAHIASIFPAGDGMAQAMSPATRAVRLAVTPAPLPDNAPFARVTMTLSALTSAPRIVLAATGDDKWAVLGQARREERPSTPLAALLAQSRADVLACVLAPGAGEATANEENDEAASGR
jgi:6-phosphogluconolactonase